nr:uncharacterized protein LOC127322764 [Lolium perenne]
MPGALRREIRRRPTSSGLTNSSTSFLMFPSALLWWFPGSKFIVGRFPFILCVERARSCVVVRSTSRDPCSTGAQAWPFSRLRSPFCFGTKRRTLLPNQHLMQQFIELAFHGPQPSLIRCSLSPARNQKLSAAISPQHLLLPG